MNFFSPASDRQEPITTAVLYGDTEQGERVVVATQNISAGTGYTYDRGQCYTEPWNDESARNYIVHRDTDTVEQVEFWDGQSPITNYERVDLLGSQYAEAMVREREWKKGRGFSETENGWELRVNVRKTKGGPVASYRRYVVSKDGPPAASGQNNYFEVRGKTGEVVAENGLTEEIYTVELKPPYAAK